MLDPTALPALDPSGPFKGTLFQMISEMGFFPQIILFILLCLSVISWAITLHKILVLRRAKWESEKFLSIFRKRHSVAEAYLPCTRLNRTPLSRMLDAGFKEMQELRRDEENPDRTKRPSHPDEFESDEHKDRWDVIRMTLERTGSEEINRLEKSVVFLATTGNISPFFGLLGTVWGIMDSFASIGVRGSASLAVVAPGIAEALIATVVGLGVAIPAVMAYNFFNSRLKVISTEVDNFALEFLSALKKESLMQ
ncbi:MAG: MotA/TolQ/ExbB proton channel family protein [Candidatus Zixiibacteriota bacterium]